METKIKITDWNDEGILNNNDGILFFELKKFSKYIFSQWKTPSSKNTTLHKYLSKQQYSQYRNPNIKKMLNHFEKQIKIFTKSCGQRDVFILFKKESKKDNEKIIPENQKKLLEIYGSIYRKVEQTLKGEINELYFKRVAYFAKTKDLEEKFKKKYFEFINEFPDNIREKRRKSIEELYDYAIKEKFFDN